MNQHLVDNINLSGHEKVTVQTTYSSEKGYQGQVSHYDAWAATCECGEYLVGGQFHRSHGAESGYEVAEVTALYLDDKNLQSALQDHIQKAILRQMAQAHINTMQVSDERAGADGNITSAIPHMKDRVLGKMTSG